LDTEVARVQGEIKKFVDEFETEIKSFELNIAENDFTRAFFKELDRRADNLQSHLRGEMNEVRTAMER
jgi:hypothetical protein